MAIGDIFVGQILLFPFDFAPAGYAKCQGQLIPISSNTALFALLGTTYGGNGTTTFALPNLQGRVALKFGQGSGLSSYAPGETGGAETVTLSISEMPQHTHALDVSALSATARCSSAAANQITPVGNIPAVESGSPATYSNSAADATMNAAAIGFGGTLTAGTAGGNQPHDNRQPYLALNYCIALQGIFPSHS